MLVKIMLVKTIGGSLPLSHISNVQIEGFYNKGRKSQKEEIFPYQKLQRGYWKKGRNEEGGHGEGRGGSSQQGVQGTHREMEDTLCNSRTPRLPFPSLQTKTKPVITTSRMDMLLFINLPQPNTNIALQLTSLATTRLPSPYHRSNRRLPQPYHKQNRRLP